MILNFFVKTHAKRHEEFSMQDTGYGMPDSGKSEKWPRSYGDGVPVGHRRRV